MNNFANFLPVSESFGSLSFPTFKKFAQSVHDHVIPHERNNYHPHMLSHRFLALLSILVLTIKIVGVSLVAFSPANSIDASAIVSETIVSLANNARAENGLGELKTSSLLAKAAQNKANDMLARQYFSHNTPDGATPWSFIKAVGYSYTTAGENLAIDFTQAESVQSAWMNSPGHRANILNANFTEIGIGIVSGTYDNHPTTIVVQMFGNPLNAPVTLKEEPTQVAPAESKAPVPETPAPASSFTPPVAQPVQIPVVQTGPVQVASEPLQIIDTKTSLQDNELYLEVTASKNTSKVLAFYGDRSIMLDPISEGLWKGNIPLSALGPNDNLAVQIQDISGRLHQEPVAQFSHSLNQTLNGNVEGAQINLFGTTLNAKFWEEKIFLVLLAAVVSLLILAIAIRRHVQHVSLVANGSFVAMLIAMMLII
jgi:uncharacterized protein YkwD